MASEASSHHSSHVPWISGIGSSTCEEKRENGGVTIVGNTSAKIISASIFLLGILEALELYVYIYISARNISVSPVQSLALIDV